MIVAMASEQSDWFIAQKYGADSPKTTTRHILNPAHSFVEASILHDRRKQKQKRQEKLNKNSKRSTEEKEKTTRDRKER